MQTTFARPENEIENPSPAFQRCNTPYPAPRFAESAPSRNATGQADPAHGDSSSEADNQSLIEALGNSKLFQDYAQAFTEATGLPIALRAVETWQLPLHGKRKEGAFCALMSETSRTCAACLQVQEQLARGAAEKPFTVNCAYGLCESAIPVRLGDRLIGFLQTGQVFLKKPTAARFEGASRALANLGVPSECAKLKEAYFATRVVPAKQHESVIKLLTIFAQHLAMLSNRLVVQKQNAELPAITRAKEYISNHQGDDMTLQEVAKAVHMSSFYFCKMFKKVVGINFTDYVSRVRIEKSKNLLLNPHLRVSEIAFEVGFQSLTHFNRIFKKVLGQSPSQYREQLQRN